MKKFILGLVIGVIISVSGSVGAMALLKSPTQDAQTVMLSIPEQIARGHKYDQYTGKKLEIPELSGTEKRFRDIEARLLKLEANR